MIDINGKNLASMMTGGKMVQTIYRNGQLIWQAVRSCFGSGHWIGYKPWVGYERWKGAK